MDDRNSYLKLKTVVAVKSLYKHIKKKKMSYSSPGFSSLSHRVKYYSSLYSLKSREIYSLDKVNRDALDCQTRNTGIRIYKKYKNKDEEP